LGPKSTPGGSKIESRSSRNVKKRPRAPQESPRSIPRAPKSVPRAPLRVPRAPQERPRASQERPRAPQEPLKSAQRRSSEPSGYDFEASKLEKAIFEGDPSLDSIEKRVRSDFRLIFEACVQEPNLDFEATLQHFLRFFKDRVVFERVRQRARNSNEKMLKSTLWESPNRPKIDQNRSSERFSSQLSRLSRSKSALRAILSRLGRSKKPVGATVEATWVDLGSLGGPVGGVRSVWSAPCPRVPYG
jgi:hypothetical protein